MSNDLTELLYEALQSPRGIVVREETGNRELLKQKLYRARRDAGDPDLTQIALTEDPDDPSALLLVKKGTTDGEG